MLSSCMYSRPGQSTFSVSPRSLLTFDDLLHEDLDLLLCQLVVRGGDPLEQVPSCTQEAESQTAAMMKGEGKMNFQLNSESTRRA